ncbi:MAG: helix-turn-helix transcriptional regulator [Lawsonibacter sp.]|nr:helix-turn-helix transcriptional regulator [Lawsonibacter sp.]
MTTGQRIKAARKKAGMTQAELAQRLDIPFQSISQWERDVRNPKKETLEKLATIFGCYYFDLYGDEEGKEAASLLKEGMRLGAQGATGLSRAEVLSEYREKGYAFTSDEESLVSAYNKLDVPTQFGVLSVVKSLADNPKHRNREINRSLTTMSEAELEALDAKDEK